MSAPVILAIGGSTRPSSSSEQAVHIAADEAERLGAEVIRITGRDLMLPIYDTETDERSPQATALVAALRRCDGLLVASPGYHGAVSGMMKNALDYAEDLARDERAYLDGRAFGCIAVAYGWQATVSTLGQLRQVAHALRAWPTPFGATVNAATTKLDEPDDATATALRTVAQQVVTFAQRHHRDVVTPA